VEFIKYRHSHPALVFIYGGGGTQIPSLPWQTPVDLSQSYFGFARQACPAGQALLKINSDFPHSVSVLTQRYSLPGLGLGCGTQTSLPRQVMSPGHMRMGIGVMFSPKMAFERPASQFWPEGAGPGGAGGGPREP